MAWIPTEQTGGPTCGGSITAGRFSIPAPEGARAGEYRVEITASRLSDRADSMSLDGTTMAYSMIQYLPARYNAESELVATVRSSGKNVYTFELTTEPEQLDVDRRASPGGAAPAGGAGGARIKRGLCIRRPAATPAR
jgi:hypothetical protein